MTKKEYNLYKQGYVDGLACFAIWRNGVQWVGDPGITLKKAIQQAETMWSYSPLTVEKRNVGCGIER